jgi:hypothetical protein
MVDDGWHPVTAENYAAGQLSDAMVALDGPGLGVASWGGGSGARHVVIDDGYGQALSGFIARGARAEGWLSYPGSALAGEVSLSLQYEVHDQATATEMQLLDWKDAGRSVRISVFGPGHPEHGRLKVEYSNGSGTSVQMLDHALAPTYTIYQTGPLNDLDEWAGDIHPGGYGNYARRFLALSMGACGLRVAWDGQLSATPSAGVMPGFGGGAGAGSYLALGNQQGGGKALDGYIDNIYVYRCEGEQTATETPATSPTRTVTATSTSTETSTETATATETPSVTVTATRTWTSTETPSATTTSTVTRSSTETTTSTETPTRTDTASATMTSTPTATLTPVLCADCKEDAGWHPISFVDYENGILSDAMVTEGGPGLGVAVWGGGPGARHVVIDDYYGQALSGFIARGARAEGWLSYPGSALSGEVSLSFAYQIHDLASATEMLLLDWKDGGRSVRISIFGPGHAEHGRLKVEYSNGSGTSVQMLDHESSPTYTIYQTGPLNDLNEWGVGIPAAAGSAEHRRYLALSMGACGLRVAWNGQLSTTPSEGVMPGFGGGAGAGSYLALGNQQGGGKALDGYIDNIYVYRCQAPSGLVAARAGSAKAETAPLGATLSAAPNPFSGRVLTVALGAPEEGRVDLQLFDLGGQSVWSGFFEALPGQNIRSVDIGRIATGIYFLQARLHGPSGSQNLPMFKLASVN